MRRFAIGAVIAAGLLGCADESTNPVTTSSTTTGSGTASSSGAGGSGAVGAGGGGAGGQACVVDTTYDPKIDPADFVAAVDNPFYPLVVGTKFIYKAGDETVTIDVMPETKVILGVTCTVVHDVATVGAEVIEDTFDWFAQDKDGAVWYFGEDTKEFRGGKVVSTEGSWTAGVDGGKPGIVIPADPMVGQQYRQEYYACHAEDEGKVLALDATAMVPAGMYTGCLKTHDFTALDPASDEEKYYCPGVGLVLSVDTISAEREELESKTP